MNVKTIVMATAIGLACGYLALLALKQPMFCCFSLPLVLILGALLGAGLAPLLHGVYLPTGSALGIGAAHGFLVAVGTAVAVWVGLYQVASDEAIRTVLTTYEQQFDIVERSMEEAGDETSEADREEFRKNTEQMRELLAKAKENPGNVRNVTLWIVVFTAGALCTLAGILGGILGRRFFGGRLRSRDAEPGADDDRMQIPDQTDRWWEKHE
jgi:hypothetical protein